MDLQSVFVSQAKLLMLSGYIKCTYMRNVLYNKWYPDPLLNPFLLIIY